MTHNAAIDRWPSISRDGKKLMYVSFRTGRSEVWLAELDKGRETALTTDGADKDCARDLARRNLVLFHADRPSGSSGGPSSMTRRNSYVLTARP